MRRGKLPTALTIAGSDSGAGAGIQADLKTFAAHGVYGTTVITTVTAQDTRTIYRAHGVHPGAVRAQIDAVLDDFGADAVKIGMLGDRRDRRGGRERAEGASRAAPGRRSRALHERHAIAARTRRRRGAAEASFAARGGGDAEPRRSLVSRRVPGGRRAGDGGGGARAGRPGGARRRRDRRTPARRCHRHRRDRRRDPSPARARAFPARARMAPAARSPRRSRPRVPRTYRSLDAIRAAKRYTLGCIRRARKQGRGRPVLGHLPLPK